MVKPNINIAFSWRIKLQYITILIIMYTHLLSHSFQNASKWKAYYQCWLSPKIPDKMLISNNNKQELQVWLFKIDLKLLRTKKFKYKVRTLDRLEYRAHKDGLLPQPVENWA